eukprot:CCRYP_001166-RA/>CCRYP_001166-RA protein AED:0.39 eAED:0.39 QI:0/0/0/1/0/0.25/4/0/603
MPSDLLTHLEAVGGELDFMDVTELQAELLKPWDQTRIASLCWFQQSGEFDSALELWEAKPTANKTLSAFAYTFKRNLPSAQKRDKQAAKSAGRGIANAVSEEELNALAMAEIVNAVQAQNNAQMEKMMEMFKASMEAMTKQQGTNTPAGGNTNTITKCPHCNLRHPKPDNCWELEKNASKRPQNWKPAAERKKAPDGGLMPASSTGLLALTTLRQGAREALVVPGLKPKALMSVSPLANNGYTTIFHPHDEGVTVHDTGSFNLTLNSPPVLQGCRNGAGLWTVPLVGDATISQSLNVEETALSVYDLPSTREVVRFLHAALGFPQRRYSPQLRSGNLVTFPGLTPDNVNRHFPSQAKPKRVTCDEPRQGVRSTKVPGEGAMLEHKPTPGVRHKDVYLRYVMIAVELGGNYIDAEPLKTRKAKDLTKLTSGFTSGGRQQESFAPTGTYSTTKRLKNSSKQFVRNGCRVELTPADMHRRNLAEKGMQTFKGHFKAVLAGVSGDFPIREWGELIPQTVLTLNLLRQSNVAPNISAYAYHHGTFDYNRMPSPQWVAQYNFTLNQTSAKHGANIQWAGGISRHLQSITGVTSYLSRKHKQSESPTQYF